MMKIILFLLMSATANGDTEVDCEAIPIREYHYNPEEVDREAKEAFQAAFETILETKAFLESIKSRFTKNVINGTEFFAFKTMRNRSETESVLKPLLHNYTQQMVLVSDKVDQICGHTWNAYVTHTQAVKEDISKKYLCFIKMLDKRHPRGWETTWNDADVISFNAVNKALDNIYRLREGLDRNITICREFKTHLHQGKKNYADWVQQDIILYNSAVVMGMGFSNLAMMDNLWIRSINNDRIRSIDMQWIHPFRGSDVRKVLNEMLMYKSDCYCY